MAADIRKRFSGRAGGGGKYTGKGRGKARGRGGATVRTTTKKIPGIDNSDLRQQLKLDYLANRDEDPSALLNLAMGLGEAEDVPGRKVVRTKRTPGRPAKGRKRGGRGAGRRHGRGKLGKLQIKPDDNMGAKQLAEYATRGVYGSGERTPEQNAAVGGASGSDHLTTRRDASAVDAKYGSGQKIANRLGLGKKWKKGSYDRHTITVDGRKYSVQILEDVEGHYDHAHVGIQRIG